MRGRSVVAIAWLTSTLGTACGGEEPATPALEVWSHGADRGRGNLLGLQAWMYPYDYRSRGTFERKLRGWLDTAHVEGLLTPDTIVVLPEYIGTWLVAMGEGDGAYSAETTSDAMMSVVLGSPIEWLALRSDASASDADTYAVFALKAEQMARTYQQVFSNLARRYGVTLVAGSTLLPAPAVHDGRLAPQPGGELQNVSAVFGPDGELLGPPVVKAYPTKDEQGFLAPGAVADLPVFDTPAGRLAVLVCADSWFPDAYQALAQRQVDILAVPSFVPGADAWSAAWKGYSGHPAPADVDAQDIGELSEGEAWSRYALPGRISLSGARAGMVVQLRGKLWDLEGGGRGLATMDGAELDVTEAAAPMLMNLWL